MPDETVEVPAVSVPKALIDQVYVDLGVAAMNHRLHTDWGVAEKFEERREMLEEYTRLVEGEDA